MPNEIQHDETRSRFTYERDGAVSYLAYRRVDEHTVDFVSTFTPPEMRGRGIAARVVERALQWADENDLKVIPTCWFVAELIERQPKWQRLLAS